MVWCFISGFSRNRKHTPKGFRSTSSAGSIPATDRTIDRMQSAVVAPTDGVVFVTLRSVANPIELVFITALYIGLEGVASSSVTDPSEDPAGMSLKSSELKISMSANSLERALTGGSWEATRLKWVPRSAGSVHGIPLRPYPMN